MSLGTDYLFDAFTRVLCEHEPGYARFMLANEMCEYKRMSGPHIYMAGMCLVCSGAIGSDAESELGETECAKIEARAGIDRISTEIGEEDTLPCEECAREDPMIARELFRRYTRKIN
jgi:hypothetical protein